MKRGGGKTPFVVGGDFEEGVAMQWLRKGMSTLVIDDFDHPKYAKFKFLHPDSYHLLSEKPGFYRTLSSAAVMGRLMQRLKEVYNTLIVFEDAGKYFGDRLTDAQMRLIGDSKQKNVDILFMFWCWGFVPPDVLRFTNYFVIGETPDTPDVRGTYLRGCINECMEAYTAVKGRKEGKPYLIVDSGI